MKRFVVAVTLEQGRTICNLRRVEISAGDTVRWTCEDSALAVDFQSDTPFTSTQVWKAGRDQMTPVATVKPGLRSGTIFRPAISIDGKVIESAGDFIVT